MGFYSSGPKIKENDLKVLENHCLLIVLSLIRFLFGFENSRYARCLNDSATLSQCSLLSTFALGSQVFQLPHMKQLIKLRLRVKKFNVFSNTFPARLKLKKQKR